MGSVEPCMRCELEADSCWIGVGVSGSPPGLAVTCSEGVPMDVVVSDLSLVRIVSFSGGVHMVSPVSGRTASLAEGASKHVDCD